MNKSQQLIKLIEKIPDRPGTADQGKWVKTRSKFHVWIKEYPDSSLGTVQKMTKGFTWDLGIEVSDTSDKSSVAQVKGNMKTSGKATTLQGAQNASDDAYRNWRK